MAGVDLARPQVCLRCSEREILCIRCLSCLECHGPDAARSCPSDEVIAFMRDHPTIKTMENARALMSIEFFRPLPLEDIGGA